MITTKKKVSNSCNKNSRYVESLIFHYETGIACLDREYVSRVAFIGILYEGLLLKLLLVSYLC